MNRKPLSVALVLLLAAGLTAVGWWVSRPRALPTSADSAAASLASGTAGSERSGAPDASRPASVPRQTAVAPAAISLAKELLPPADSPVTDVYDDLLAKARRGDSRAACRLASDLQRCQKIRSQWDAPHDMTDLVLREKKEARLEPLIDYAARYEEERERMERFCANVTAEQLDQAFALQMQAAQARPELRVWAAIHPALDPRLFVNDLERWQQYRSVALPWLEAAAAEGDATALMALTRVHGDQRSVSAPPIRQIDDARLLTYATLLERYGMTMELTSRIAEEARNRLEPTAQAQAEERAAALFRPERMAQSGKEARQAMNAALQRTYGSTRQGIDCQ